MGPSHRWAVAGWVSDGDGFDFRGEVDGLIGESQAADDGGGGFFAAGEGDADLQVTGGRGSGFFRESRDRFPWTNRTRIPAAIAFDVAGVAGAGGDGDLVRRGEGQAGPGKRESCPNWR